jgi:hypothetical protein
MGCRRASSTLLVVLLAVSLLTLDRPVAHARHGESIFSVFEFEYHLSSWRVLSLRMLDIIALM